MIGIVALVLLWPVFALVAAAIRLDSGAPIFFFQERIGLKGRPFTLFKFRTMHLVSQTRSEWVRDNEERITRVGWWLRRFRLDEMPQFFNMALGHMNLVGPRPHPVSNHELFAEQIPFYSVRSTVRPGITGWAQINYGYANSLEEEAEKMRYDLYYIKHMSFWLDLVIVFGTLKVMLSGRGS